MKIVITGAGGFLGGHLHKRLVEDGHKVYGVDIKHHDDWWQRANAMTHRQDLRWPNSVTTSIMREADEVYHLACDMGGRGYIDTHEADCAMNAALDLAVLKCAVEARVKRFFYASSACVYPVELQGKVYGATSGGFLNEAMADPPWHPDDMYGHAKLFGELSCAAFAADYGLHVRIGRFHGVYGSHGDWSGGREKAPAALMRKVAEAKRDAEDGGKPVVVVWGDGTATRTFMHVDDAVEGMIRLMRSGVQTPMNLGSAESVSVTDLLTTIAEVAGLDRFDVRHVDGPVGVDHRASDNSLIRRFLKWEPGIELREGIKRTYPWIEEQVRKQ